MAKGASALTAAWHAAAASALAGAVEAARAEWASKATPPPLPLLPPPTIRQVSVRSAQCIVSPACPSGRVQVSFRSSERQPAETLPGRSRFDLKEPGHVQPQSATSFRLLGSLVYNTTVPYKFRAILTCSDDLMIHVGLLLEASLKVDRHSWNFALLDRVDEKLRVHFIQTREAARTLVKEVLSSCRRTAETADFESQAPALELADFFKKEIARGFEIPKGEQNFMSKLEGDLSVTNCAFFAIRAGTSCFGAGPAFKRSLIERIQEVQR